MSDNTKKLIVIIVWICGITIIAALFAKCNAQIAVNAGYVSISNRVDGNHPFAWNVGYTHVFSGHSGIGVHANYGKSSLQGLNFSHVDLAAAYRVENDKETLRTTFTLGGSHNNVDDEVDFMFGVVQSFYLGDVSWLTLAVNNVAAVKNITYVLIGVELEVESLFAPLLKPKRQF